MRVACLIVGYNAPQVLAASLRIFQAAGWDIFLHLDQKMDSVRYMDEVGLLAGTLRLVKDPVNIFWGGFSMMEAEFRLIRTAMSAGSYDRFLLISDDTLPVYGPSDLNRLLADSRDRITVNLQQKHSEFYKRYYNFFFFDHGSLNPRGSRWPLVDAAAFEGVSEAFYLQRLGKKQIDVYHGSQWWSLSARTLERAIKICESDWHLLKSFQFSALSDELMIQSVIGNYILREGALPGPVFADFSAGHGPLVYTNFNDLPGRIGQECLFIRKFSWSATDLINDCVDLLMKDEPLYREGLRQMLAG